MRECSSQSVGVQGEMCVGVQCLLRGFFVYWIDFVLFRAFYFCVWGQCLSEACTEASQHWTAAKHSPPSTLPPTPSFSEPHLLTAHVLCRARAPCAAALQVCPRHRSPASCEARRSPQQSRSALDQTAAAVAAASGGERAAVRGRTVVWGEWRVCVCVYV